MRIFEKMWNFYYKKVNTISWSPDGIHILSGSDDKFLKISNAFDKNCVCFFDLIYYV